jgi:hypothetical protein
MMWTDLHRGHLAQMKKCISTETEPARGMHNVASSRVVESMISFWFQPESAGEN